MTGLTSFNECKRKRYAAALEWLCVHTPPEEVPAEFSHLSHSSQATRASPNHNSRAALVSSTNERKGFQGQEPRQPGASKRKDIFIKPPEQPQPVFMQQSGTALPRPPPAQSREEWYIQQQQAMLHFYNSQRKQAEEHSLPSRREQHQDSAKGTIQQRHHSLQQSQHAQQHPQPLEEDLPHSTQATNHKHAKKGNRQSPGPVPPGFRQPTKDQTQTVLVGNASTARATVSAPPGFAVNKPDAAPETKRKQMSHARRPSGCRRVVDPEQEAVRAQNESAMLRDKWSERLASDEALIRMREQRQRLPAWPMAQKICECVRKHQVCLKMLVDK